MKIYPKTIVALFVALILSVEPCLAVVPIEAYRSYIRGLLAARSGNIEQALSDYKRTTDMDKNAVYVYKDLALYLWQAGKSDEALGAAKKLKESYSDNLSILLFLGSFYLLAGEPALARDCWEKVLVIDPDNETAELYMAAFHASDNNPEKAITYWNKFIRQEPDSSQAYYQLGLSQEKLQEVEKAKESFQKSLSLSPVTPEAHLALAQIYEKEEKYMAAAQEYEKYLELAPENLTVMLYLGGYYYRLKNHDAAENVFLKAYRLNPSDITVCFWLGVIAEEKKDWDAAINYFEAIARKEKTPAVLYRLSYYYSSKKDYKSALKRLNEAVKLEPDNPVSYYMLGLTYFDLGKMSRAEANLLKAKSLKPGMEGVSFHLGMLYDQKGRFDKAAEEMESEIKANPNYAPALNYLGYSFAEKGIRLDEALDLIKRATEQEPDNASYIDSLGWLYFKKGDYEKAAQYLNLACEKLLDTTIFEHVGDLYAKQHKTLDAWNAYRKSLDLDPRNKSALKKLWEMEKLVLPSTLQRKVLKRAVGNLLQVSSLKAGFRVSGSSAGVNLRFAGFFQYARPGLWRVDVLGNFLAPQIVIIQNNGIKLYPEALRADISSRKMDIFERIRNYFGAGLLEEFDSDKTVSERRGNSYYYRLGEKTMVIDSKNGTVREFRPGNGVIFKFTGYSLEEGLYIPVDMEVYSQEDKISANIKLKNCVINQPIEDSTFTINPSSATDR